MRLKPSVVISTCVASLLSAATALGQTYGIVATGDVTTYAPKVIIDAAGNPEVLPETHPISNSFSTSFLPQTSYSSPLFLGSSQEVTYIDYNQGGGLYTDSDRATLIFLSANSGLLNGEILSRSSTVNADTLPYNGVSVQTSILWQDTLFVTSSTQRVGTPVTLLVSNSMFGDIQTGGNGTTLYNYNSSLVDRNNPYGADVFDQTFSRTGGVSVDHAQSVFYTQVGAELTRSEQLNISTLGCCDYTAELSANDAFTNVVDLTGGSSVVSESAVDYSAVGRSVAVPEPAGVSLMALALGLVLAPRQRAASRQAHRAGRCPRTSA